MRYTTLLASLAAPLLVSARPIRSRAASADDALVFQFANVLEQLETEFYAQGIAKFVDADYTAAGFTSPEMVKQFLATIHADEATHAGFLEQALQDNGATPLMCQFDFSKVLTDVATMAATARVVELVGVSAYLGGATLLGDPVFLDAAASILTVEARHQTLLNLLGGGALVPSPFDIALTPQEVLSIATQFITGDCDTGITPTNTLTITNTQVEEGTLLTFTADGMSTDTDGLFCNMIVGGAPFAINLPLDQCTVPPGINGPVAVWVTSDSNPLINNVIDRDTTKQVAGPAFIEVDSQPDLLSQLVRSTGTAATTETTTTITPAEANSIIQNASGTATASGSSATSGTDSSSSPPSGSSSGSDSAPSAPPSNPLPLDFTGKSPDGKVNVLGLSSVPAPTGSAAATSSASDSAPSASTSSS
jgi:hypothetical protein